jgi:class 3 adenylate cyclase
MPNQKRQLAAIMFTDIVGYTRMMGHDEDKAFQVLENNRALHKDLLILYGGQLLKEIGDGMLCSFESASNAVKCAIELVRKSNKYKDLKLRIGIHIGEVVFSGNDVFGDGVNIASRIESMAVSDSVLISEQVYDQIKNKQNIRVKHIGTYELKNDTKPREIYAIANTKLKVPAGKDLISLTEDKPEQQQAPSSGISNGKKQTANRSRFSSPRIGLTLLFSLMAVAFGSFLFISFRNSAKVKWAREEAIIKIEELIETEQIKQAFQLGEEAEKYIPNDPLLKRLWPRMEYHLVLDTDPSGAQVFRKRIYEPNSEYQLIGITPLDSLRTYRGFSTWSIVREGYDTLEFMNAPFIMQNKTYRLSKPGAYPDNMLFVPFDQWRYWPTGWILGLGDAGKPALNDYLVDKYEVTNQEFKEFVNLGGYSNKEYWKQPFIKDGSALSREEAMKLFVDATGHPGPATWEIGDFPEGQENYPVTGISWYEAMAYAKFAEKDLPTVFQWIFAASPGRGKEINPSSNFSKKGPAPIGSYKGLGVYGTYDMAGNVREWCVNRVAGQENRFILGGAWDELPYNSANARALDPFDRSSLNGFRCIKYIEKSEESIFDDVPVLVRDYSNEKPVNDATFKLFLNDFKYEKTAFDEEIQSVDFGDPDFTCQKIYINSTYNDERLCLYLFLPTNHPGPFQTIFNFPSAWAFNLDNYEEIFDIARYNYDFFIKSGRALAIPVLAGMYGREGMGKGQSLRNARMKENIISYIKDVQRHIDYLESRDDLTADFGYYGSSFGAMFGPMVLSIEKRFKVAVLKVGGLPSHNPYPENDLINYLPRANIPILMLNGKHDHIFSLETSVKSMFNLLGTAPKHKKLLIYEAGHTGPPRNELIKESLNWIDTYLGPVKQGL